MNDERKKVIILACLGFCVVTIGAMQLVGHKRPPALPDKPKELVAAVDTKGATTVAGIKNPEVADSLPDRDPFLPPADADPKPATPVATPRIADVPAPFPHRSHSNANRAFDPLPLPGALPSAKGLAGQPAGTLTPVQNYRCVAVIQGSKPIAVFEDSTGNQKLVRVGAPVDGDTKLTEVHGNSVSIEVRGEKRRLTIGGNPVGK